jgi:hypothetical protein
LVVTLTSLIVAMGDLVHQKEVVAVEEHKN